MSQYGWTDTCLECGKLLTARAVLEPCEEWMAFTATDSNSVHNWKLKIIAVVVMSFLVLLFAVIIARKPHDHQAIPMVFRVQAIQELILLLCPWILRI